MGAMGSMRAAAKTNRGAGQPPTIVYQVSAEYLRKGQFEKLLENDKLAPAADDGKEGPARSYYRLLDQTAAAAAASQPAARRDYLIQATTVEINTLVWTLAKQAPEVEHIAGGLPAEAEKAAAAVDSKSEQPVRRQVMIRLVAPETAE